MHAECIAAYPRVLFSCRTLVARGFWLFAAVTHGATGEVRLATARACPVTRIIMSRTARTPGITSLTSACRCWLACTASETASAAGKVGGVAVWTVPVAITLLRATPSTASAVRCITATRFWRAAFHAYGSPGEVQFVTAWAQPVARFHLRFRHYTLHG